MASAGTSSYTDESIEEVQGGTSRIENDENRNVHQELNDFRMKWQKEISIGMEDKCRIVPLEGRSEDRDDVESKAKNLFLQGIDKERRGEMYDAIKYYRKAVQLVPDIESKLDEATRSSSRNDDDEGEDNDAARTISGDDESLTDDEEELLPRLQRWFSTAPALCMPAVETRSTHISSLPIEILLVIFKWVVSQDLDVRSLEMCGMVSRGFYLCSRDSEIWKLICLRSWGTRCGQLSSYSSWREMYLHRPHLNYTGCYISKTTYFRHGENSFQDQYYRPWHVVEYFRYLRFFPEGNVLMMTTPESPQPIINQLRFRNARNPAILFGQFVIYEDRIALCFKREQHGVNNNRFAGRPRRTNPDFMSQTFNIELEVRKKRKSTYLVWKKFKIESIRGSTETVTNFDVSSNKFPPFWFSRVKSYCADTERPLT